MILWKVKQMINCGGIKRCSLVYILSLIMTWTLIMSCATWSAKANNPDWVDGTSSEYPSNHFIIGVGYGPERQNAADNARAEIAKVFEAKIQQRSIEFDQYLQIASGGTGKSTRELDIQQITSISTKKILSGISLVDHYIDGVSQPPIHYTLAVLNRSQAGNLLRYKIVEADREILQLRAFAESSSDPLHIIQSLKQAIRAAVLREAYNMELRVVNLQGRGIATGTRLQELKTELAGVLKDKFNLSVEVAGSYQAQIKQALTEELTRSGFVINPDPSRATVIIRGNVNITLAAISHPKWKYVRWTVDFQMIDRINGKIFGSVGTAGKEGHLTEIEAEKKAVRTVQQKLISEVCREINDYIFGR